MAATGPDHHVPVFLQDDVGAVIKVEDGDGVELGGGAAGLGHRVWVDEVDLQHSQSARGEGQAWPQLSPRDIYYLGKKTLTSARYTHSLGSGTVPMLPMRGPQHRASSLIELLCKSQAGTSGAGQPCAVGRSCRRQCFL